MMLYPCTPAPPITHELFREPTTRDSLARTSLAVLLVGGMFTLAGVVLSAWLGVAGWLHVDPPFAVDGNARTAVFLAGLLVPLLLCVAVEVLLLVPPRLAREQRWLASLPFAFAQEGYLHAMAKERDKAEIELVLHFAGPVRAEVVTAVAESHGVGSTPRPRGPSTLRLSSPAFGARQAGSTPHATPDSYSNAALHRWFRGKAVPMLVELKQGHGLESVELEV